MSGSAWLEAESTSIKNPAEAVGRTFLDSSQL